MTQQLDRHAFNATAQRVYNWTGPLLIGLFFIGWLMSGLIPAPSPDDSAEQIVEKFTDHQTRTRIGCLVTLIAARILPKMKDLMAVTPTYVGAGQPRPNRRGARTTDDHRAIRRCVLKLQGSGADPDVRIGHSRRGCWRLMTLSANKFTRIGRGTCHGDHPFNE